MQQPEFKEYQLLKRVLKEQNTLEAKDSCIQKHKTKFTTLSLQIPSDPDATNRKKAEKSHKGYVVNTVETFDKKSSNLRR